MTDDIGDIEFIRKRREIRRAQRKHGVDEKGREAMKELAGMLLQNGGMDFEKCPNCGGTLFVSSAHGTIVEECMQFGDKPSCGYRKESEVR